LNASSDVSSTAAQQSSESHSGAGFGIDKEHGYLKKRTNSSNLTL
jgi:hypothetical protein